MLKALKNEIRLCGPASLACAIFVLGAYLVGFIILMIVMKADAEATFFPMGGIMAIVGGMMGQIFYDGISFSTDYSLAVTMSRRRLYKILAHIIVALLRMIVVSAVVALLMGLDTLLARSVYFGRDLEFDFTGIINFGTVAAYVLVSVILTVLIAAVKVRFGRKGWTALYIIFIFSTIFLPRIIEMCSERPEHPLSRALRAVFIPIIEAMTPALAIAIAAAAGIIILLISARMMMKASVVMD